MGMIDSFWNQHARIVRMVKSAIDMYNQQHGGPKYELHIICGVNDCVDGPVFMTPVKRMYHCSHINFLASRSAGTYPEQFFAECRNDGSVVDLCYPVGVPLPGAEQVRCLYCEISGSRVVHPVNQSFHGCDREFEKMLSGEGVYSEWHTNDGLIHHSHVKTHWVKILKDDHIYCVYSCDNEDDEDDVNHLMFEIR